MVNHLALINLWAKSARKHPQKLSTKSIYIFIIPINQRIRFILVNNKDQNPEQEIRYDLKVCHTKTMTKCKSSNLSLLTPEIREIQESIWEILLLNSSWDDIIATIKMEEKMDMQIEWFEAHAAVDASTVVCQGTLHIVQWDVGWLNPGQWALYRKNKCMCNDNSPYERLLTIIQQSAFYMKNMPCFRRIFIWKSLNWCRAYGLIIWKS